MVVRAKPANGCRNKMTVIRLFVVGLSLSALFFGQSATTATSRSGVHISGSISQCGESVPGIVVRFEGNAPQLVNANDAGVYEADLPLGIWTETTDMQPLAATAGNAAVRSLSRPRHFRLSAPGSLVLDIQLRPPVGCSVAIFTPGGHLATPEQESERDTYCWGEKFFPAPSSDGVPFEVDLFGLVADTGVDACSTNHSKTAHREFATFNLLSVHADKVIYHPGERILEASGNVVVADESGKRRKDSAKFEIGDGQAKTLQ
jgi:hypothetical protein